MPICQRGLLQDSILIIYISQTKDQFDKFIYTFYICIAYIYMHTQYKYKTQICCHIISYDHCTGRKYLEFVLEFIKNAYPSSASSSSRFSVRDEYDGHQQCSSHTRSW